MKTVKAYDDPSGRIIESDEWCGICYGEHDFPHPAEANEGCAVDCKGDYYWLVYCTRCDKAHYQKDDPERPVAGADFSNALDTNRFIFKSFSFVTEDGTTITIEREADLQNPNNVLSEAVLQTAKLIVECDGQDFSTGFSVDCTETKEYTGTALVEEGWFEESNGYYRYVGVL